MMLVLLPAAKSPSDMQELSCHQTGAAAVRLQQFCLQDSQQGCQQATDSAATTGAVQCLLPVLTASQSPAAPGFCPA
jgi:hypothetical protein